MPNNILKDFFYGNINPNEKQFDRNSEYGKAAAGLADEEEKLRSMLDQEAATVLDKMICLQAAIAGMTAEEYFIDGLRTGFRLALAILDEEENGLPSQYRMAANSHKLHNILRSSLCSILSEMALLLSSFRANMCTPKGKTHSRKAEKRRISE